MLHQRDIRNSLIHYGFNKNELYRIYTLLSYLTVHNRVRQSVLWKLIVKETNKKRKIKLNPARYGGIRARKSREDEPK